MVVYQILIIFLCFIEIADFYIFELLQKMQQFKIYKFEVFGISEQLNFKPVGIPD